jgi:hypothetical protein
MLKLTLIGLAALGAGVVAQDQWSATVRGMNGSGISGTANAEGVGSADSTLVKISIKGAPAGALPWHIHTGSCKAPGAVFGSEAAYPRLQAGSGGSAEGSVVLPVRPAKAATYAIQIHRGAGGAGQTGSDVIGCGDLLPVLNKTP